MADNEMNGWISFMKTMVASVNDHRVKASSISDVPGQVRKSREEAYMPKVVSIGPLHRGTRRELLYMEEIKWRCMRSLLYRTPEPEESMKKWSAAIYELDEAVRASYANDIKLNSYELAKIMFLDGCFLLELLISNVEVLDSANRSRSPGPGDRVGKMELVLSDLKKLENQIPIFILVKLFQYVFSSETFEDARKMVNGSALFLFGCSSNFSPLDSPNCAHFLELMHWFMIREEDGIGSENNHRSLNVDANGTFNNRSAIPKLERCATSLTDAGVTIAPLHAEGGGMSIRPGDMQLVNNNDAIIFGCNVMFSGRNLKIQPLHITETTEVQWRNFIAWEHNRTTHENLLLREDNPTRCKFSQYALLFKDLVCCEHDVQLLKDRNVLDDEAKRSNEDLMTLFREIVSGIQIDTSGDFTFRQLIKDLNAGSGARGNLSLFWHRCRSIATSTRYTCRDWYVTLKRDHTPTVWKTIGVIAAIVLLGLTIAQTIFAALSL